jgi:putative ABC transport system permease protein
MLSLAAKMLRHRLGGMIATLIALAFGVAILTAVGGAVESGLRYHPGPGRYAAADIVLAHRTITVTSKDIDGEIEHTTVDLPEGGTVPAGLAAQVARVPGVASAVADSPYPGRVEAVLVKVAPGADHGAVLAAVRPLAAQAGARAYTGADRGYSTAGTVLIEIGGSFGGYVVLLIVFVVAGTIGLSVRHRRRDLALLRAVAATPGQVRQMIVAEAALVSVAAAVLGVPAGVLAIGWMRGELVTRGLIPAGFPVHAGVLSTTAAVLLIVVAAVLAGLIAARRTTRIRPVEALGEIAVERARSGKVRLGFGLATLAGGVALAVFTQAVDGEVALTGAVGLLYLLVLAVALLAPWINQAAARVTGPLLRAVWRQSGYLAAKNLRANARGMTTVLTALVLSVGFGGSVWFLQDNLQRQTIAQYRSGMLADHALVAPGGLPESAVTAATHLSGVEGATDVRQSTVLISTMGDAETFAAQGVDPAGLAKTVDLGVTAGSLTALGPDSVAVSAMDASTFGWHLNERVHFWLGDGTPVALRVVALYDRGLGFGDLVLDNGLLAGHTASGRLDRVLVRSTPGTDLTSLTAAYPGGSVLGTSTLTGQLATDRQLGAWLNKLLIGVMVGYAALAAANTMVMAALARRRELALLRLVGVTRGQVKRMVHAEQVGLLGTALLIGTAIAGLTLSSVVDALTDSPVPYVPALGYVVVLGGATVLALTTTVLPVARLLRR